MIRQSVQRHSEKIMCKTINQSAIALLAYLPFQIGLRFSEKARGPSTASWLA